MAIFTKGQKIAIWTTAALIVAGFGAAFIPILFGVNNSPINMFFQNQRLDENIKKTTGKNSDSLVQQPTPIKREDVKKKFPFKKPIIPVINDTLPRKSIIHPEKKSEYPEGFGGIIVYSRCPKGTWMVNIGRKAANTGFLDVPQYTYATDPIYTSRDSVIYLQLPAIDSLYVATLWSDNGNDKIFLPVRITEGACFVLPITTCPSLPYKNLMRLLERN